MEVENSLLNPSYEDNENTSLLNSKGAIIEGAISEEINTEFSNRNYQISKPFRKIIKAKLIKDDED